MKQPDAIASEVRVRLTRTWATTLAVEVGFATAGEQRAWPHQFTLGQPTPSGELMATWSQVLADSTALREFAHREHLTLSLAPRRIGGTLQQLPTHVLVPDIDTAARLAGVPWPDRLARGRARAGRLAVDFAGLGRPTSVLNLVDSYDDIDFDLACRAGTWFASHDADGRTARQIPVDGMHAKWLDNHKAVVMHLSGRTDLALSGRPAQLHLTYLDPTHLAAGGRRHDIATVGDAATLAYTPTLVLISENKDTAVFFPPVPGAIAVQGGGDGGSACASFDWLVNAPQLLYWGDIDADGLEALDEFRASGVPARSVLMDEATYTTWRRYGTDTDMRGVRLGPRPTRCTPNLTGSERHLYEKLAGPVWDGPRRLEQERIPLEVAHGVVCALAGAPAPEQRD